MGLSPFIAEYPMRIHINTLVIEVLMFLDFKMFNFSANLWIAHLSFAKSLA